MQVTGLGSSVKELGDYVDGQWEDDRRILLGRYCAQSLQVAKLKNIKNTHS